MYEVTGFRHVMLSDVSWNPENYTAKKVKPLKTPVLRTCNTAKNTIK